MAMLYSNGRYKLLALPSNTAVLKTLERGEVSQAIVALENVCGGGVTEVEDRLIDDAKNGRHFKVTAELLLPIKHLLLAKKGAKLSGIKKIYSHPQAIAQCGLFVFQNGIKTIEMDSTAKAAEMVAKSHDLTIGAIASSDAAKKYKLEVIVENIGDRKNNMTKFIVLGGPSPLPTGEDKTTIFFTLKNISGTLCEVLEVFRDKEINLSKISSRPLNDDARPWEYIFWIDIDGHAEEEPLISTIELLGGCTENYWVIGSYPKANLVGG
jgi:prephenate dehydratase